jgi:hypothetical protein
MTNIHKKLQQLNRKNLATHKALNKRFLDDLVSRKERVKI